MKTRVSRKVKRKAPSTKYVSSKAGSGGIERTCIRFADRISNLAKTVDSIIETIGSDFRKIVVRIDDIDNSVNLVSKGLKTVSERLKDVERNHVAGVQKNMAEDTPSSPAQASEIVSPTTAKTFGG